MNLPRLLVLLLIAFVLFRLVGSGADDISASDISPRHDVVMFSAPWCGYCDQARDYLERHEVDFLEIDIESSTRSRRQFEEVNGRGVPLTFFGDQRLAGFSSAAYRRAIEQNR